jgi:hypothetical protein
LLIQRNLRNRVKAKFEKMEVLMNLWDNIYDEINAQALKTKDSKMKIFCLVLNSIPI